MALRFTKKLFALFFVLLASFSCMDYGPMDEQDFGFGTGDEGLFVVNEGNFNYGNSTLYYYIPSQKKVVEKVFRRANGIDLGDSANSMVVRNGLGYVVVNNSGVIFVIDVSSFKVVGMIKGFTSPRSIHLLSDSKAYVTDMYSGGLYIVDLRERKITGRVDTGAHASTEQMVQEGDYVFVSCWVADDKILVIDSNADEVVDEITVGVGPASLAIDRNGKLWTLCDGGYGSVRDSQGLYRIDTETLEVEESFLFGPWDYPSKMCIDGEGGALYFINGSLWRMDVEAGDLPTTPFLQAAQGQTLYGLSVDPVNSDVYVADPLDFSQPGIVYRYSQSGTLLDSFGVGIIPGSFCFR